MMNDFILVGIIVGGVVFGGILLFLIFWVLFRNKRVEISERGSAEVVDAEKLPLAAYLDKKVPIVRPPPRQVQIESATQLAHFYLRASPYRFQRALPDMGSRKDKFSFLIRSSFRTDQLLTIVPRNRICVFDFRSEVHTKALKQILLALHKHPFVFPVLECEAMAERDSLILIRHFGAKDGSLKDFMHKSDPREDFSKKYVKLSRLPPERVALFGRQILEGLLFLREKGIPFGHLSSSNVIVEDGVCRLSDYENGLLNLEPRTFPLLVQLAAKKVDADVAAFGLLLFEMLLGYEFPSDVRFNTNELYFIPPKCPQQIKRLLESIFSPVGDPLTIRSLLADPFFAPIILRSDQIQEMKSAEAEQFDQKTKDFLKAAWGICMTNDYETYKRAKETGEFPKEFGSLLSGATSSNSVAPKKKKKKPETEPVGTSVMTSSSPLPVFQSARSLSSVSPQPTTSSSSVAPPPPPRSPAPPQSTGVVVAKPAPAPQPPKAPSAAKAPPPPPAPSGGAKGAPAPPPPPPASKASGGKGALLSSITTFNSKALKKTVTVDKSAPKLGKK